MSALLVNIGHALRAAGRETGYERRIHLEVAGDLMRQYQRRVEMYLQPIEIMLSPTDRCGHCGRHECSH